MILSTGKPLLPEPGGRPANGFDSGGDNVGLVDSVQDLQRVEHGLGMA